MVGNRSPRYESVPTLIALAIRDSARTRNCRDSARRVRQMTEMFSVPQTDLDYGLTSAD
jgi:hypothetical protein